MRTYGAYDESQKRGAAYWQRHQVLVIRAGGICEYLQGAAPRWEPEGKAPATGASRGGDQGKRPRGKGVTHG